MSPSACLGQREQRNSSISWLTKRNPAFAGLLNLVIVPLTVVAAATITATISATVMTVVIVVVVTMVSVTMFVTSTKFNDDRRLFNPTAMTMAIVPTAFAIADLFDSRGFCG